MTGEGKGLFRRIYDVFFRPENFTCRVCGREVFDGSFVCRECNDNLAYNDKIVCDKCGRRQPAAGVCRECKAVCPKTDAARSCFSFDGGVRKLVYSFKNGSRLLAVYFAELLEATYRKHFSDQAIDCLAYVPMTKKDERARGFNQSRELAVRLGKRIGLPVEELLVKRKPSLDQRGLGIRERRKNLQDCFKATKGARGRRILLVDDVLTTGATSDAIAEELKKKGAERVFLLTVASVEFEKKKEEGNV